MMMVATPHHHDQKLFVTYTAKAALAGHQLTRTADGYMLSKWTHSRHCADLATVATLLRAMGVKL
jgi:hypothetical protein